MRLYVGLAQFGSGTHFPFGIFTSEEKGNEYIATLKIPPRSKPIYIEFTVDKGERH